MPGQPVEALECRRLFAALVVDLSFGSDGGIAVTDGHALGQSGGRIYVVENARTAADAAALDPADYRAVATRYHGDGSTDAPVGPAPYFAGPTANGVVDAAGRVVFAAPVGDTVVLSRYTPSNKRDRTFAARFTPPGLKVRDHVVAGQVLAASDGSTFVRIDFTQTDTYGPYTHAWLAKVDANGNPVVRFGDNGLLDLGTADGTTPTAVAGVDASGGVYLQRDNTIVRFGPNGTRDRGFATGGTLRPAGGPKAVAVDVSGRLLVVTTDAGGASLTRYDADGRPDLSFADGGTLRFAGGSSPAVRALLPQADDSLVLQLGDRIRLISDNAVTLTDDTGTADPVIARQADGRYLVRTDSAIERLAPPTRVAINGYGTAYVRTGAGADTVHVTAVGRTDTGVYPQSLRVTIGDKAFRLSKVSALDVDLGDGDNVFTAAVHVDSTLVSGNGDDRVTAGDGFNRIFTGDGNDTIQGGVNSDEIHPGGGANTMDVGSGGSTDFVSIGNSNAAGFGDTGTVDGAAGRQIITGLEDTVPGRRLNVYLSHGASADIDWTGDSAKVTVDGDAANDITLHTTKRSRVTTGGGDDTIRTGTGNDVMDSGAGNDLLAGGPGHDQLFGGVGTDTGVNDANDATDSIERHRNR